MTTENSVLREKRFLTYAEACARLGCSRWSLRRAVERGELTAYRRVGLIRFDVNEIDRWFLDAPTE